jgi:hypothetical protein
MVRIIFVLALIGLALVTPARNAGAAWLVDGGWVSNICRANANPSYYFAYPAQDGEAVGTPCAFPDGTPGTITAN